MKRKVIRAVTGLLCAAMVFSNVAGMSVYAMEDGGGQEMQESISGNDDTGETWEELEEAEQESADSDAEPEEPAEAIDSNKEEDGQKNGEAEDEAAETVPEDMDEDPDETETVSENTVEGEGVVEEEIEEESLVFLMTMAEKLLEVHFAELQRQKSETDGYRQMSLF